MRIASRLHGLIAPIPIVLATLGPASNVACASHSCTSLYVPSKVSITRTVAATFDISKPIHVELCRNDECESGDFLVGTGTAGQQRLCATKAEATFEDGCVFRRLDDGSWELYAYWDVTRRSPNDGDRYRMDLTSSDVDLLVVDAIATYDESEPNGEGCGVRKEATL